MNSMNGERSPDVKAGGGSPTFQFDAGRASRSLSRHLWQPRSARGFHTSACDGIADRQKARNSSAACSPTSRCAKLVEFSTKIRARCSG